MELRSCSEECRVSAAGGLAADFRFVKATNSTNKLQFEMEILGDLRSHCEVNLQRVQRCFRSVISHTVTLHTIVASPHQQYLYFENTALKLNWCFDAVFQSYCFIPLTSELILSIVDNSSMYLFCEPVIYCLKRRAWIGKGCQWCITCDCTQDLPQGSQGVEQQWLVKLVAPSCSGAGGLCGLISQ